MRALHGLLLLGLLATPLFVPQLQVWPWHLLVPLALYALVVLLIPALRATVVRPPFGRLDGRLLVLILGVSAAAAGFLVLWDLLFHLDLTWVSSRLPTDGLVQTMLLLGVLIVVNALLEELIWRGIVLDALAAWSGVPGALVAQAVAFGVSHCYFLAPSWAAVFLSFLYGLALGGLWWKARGILAPLLAHALTDFALAALVVLHIVDPGGL